jgi:hypothetical protein
MQAEERLQLLCKTSTAGGIENGLLESAGYWHKIRSMRDLRSPGTMWVKLLLFLLIGLISAVLLWLDAPTLKNAILLLLAIWSFCRAYYFAFYVLEKYIDPQFRFSGLGSLLLYLFRRRNSKEVR